MFCVSIFWNGFTDGADESNLGLFPFFDMNPLPTRRFYRVDQTLAPCSAKILGDPLLTSFESAGIRAERDIFAGDCSFAIEA